MYAIRSYYEIVGQEHITTTLRNALKGGRIAHAYLLTGPRGVGKTSIARILAHEVNGLPYSEESNLDIIEIDAASNNGVEDVRELRDKIPSAPVGAKYKVFIIDEVHMLSKAAFNARITSYNVCYTKLLREVAFRSRENAPNFGDNALAGEDLCLIQTGQQIGVRGPGQWRQ